MTAADHVGGRLAASVEVMGRIRRELTRLEHALPSAARWTGEVRQLLIELNAQLQLIKVDMAVDVQTGAAAPLTAQRPHAELELFMPRSEAGIDEVRREVDARILAALHRANDHTLDATDDVMESGVAS